MLFSLCGRFPVKQFKYEKYCFALWLTLTLSSVLQRKAQERQIDSPDCQLSPVAVGAILTPPNSTEKPANPWAGHDQQGTTRETRYLSAVWPLRPHQLLTKRDTILGKGELRVARFIFFNTKSELPVSLFIHLVLYKTTNMETVRNCSS